MRQAVDSEAESHSDSYKRQNAECQTTRHRVKPLALASSESAAALSSHVPGRDPGRHGDSLAS
jgi:hypothetical protein